MSVTLRNYFHMIDRQCDGGCKCYMNAMTASFECSKQSTISICALVAEELTAFHVIRIN